MELKAGSLGEINKILDREAKGKRKHIQNMNTRNENWGCNY